MKLFLRRVLPLMLGLVMTLSMAACGSSGNETNQPSANAPEGTAAAEAPAASGEENVTIRITWWGGQARHEYTQKILDTYTSLHPNVTFEAVPSGWDGYFEKLATDTATGGMPDIVQMDYLYIATYANNNSLHDMSEYIDNGTIQVSDLDEALLGSGQINGKTVGIPVSSSLIAFSYNPQVLQEAGVEVPTADWTWDEFAEMSKAIVEKTGKYSFDGQPVTDTNFFNYWLRDHGAKLFADDYKSLGYEDDALTADFFQYWMDLIEIGAVPNPDEYEQIATLGKEASPVITNDAAFRQDWTNFTGIAAAAGNDTLKMLPPPNSGTNNQALWNKPGMFLCVAETSKVKDECAKFIDWFLNSKEANDIMLGERGIPSSAAVRDYLANSGKLSAQQIDMFNLATDMADYCGEVPAPDPAGISEVNSVFKDIAYSVFYGQTTPEDAAAQFRTEANRILSENN